MKMTEQISQTPIPVQKSVRPIEVRGMTSCRAGVVVPHFGAFLLREDRVSRGKIQVTIRQEETVRPLANATSVKVSAYLIPMTAFERFDGSVEKLNKSYRKVKDRDADASPIPFFQTMTYNRTHAFWQKMGIHHPNTTAINSVYVEAYNTLVNWLRSMRAKDLAVRTLNDTTLAQAFWNHPFMWHIKPDFDQAMMDGEVELSWTNPKVPVSGIGVPVGVTWDGAAGTVNETAGAKAMAAGGGVQSRQSPSSIIVRREGTTAFPAVYAEMQASGAKISLANIELAKQTAAFAKLREQYKGVDDDHLVDLLMSGIHLPDSALRQPILLDQQLVTIGQTEHYATDGDNLAKSRTRGAAVAQLTIRTPAVNTAGVIMIVSQIVPEQLFERMQDPILSITDPAKLPEFLRDFLDPEKVETVPNSFVDTLHGTPTGVFGFAPLNHAWKQSLTHLGGKFFRPVPDAFVEDRQRFWSVETPNPALNSAFYLVPADLPHSVFADTLADPFEIEQRGFLEVVGNTVFGATFNEDDGNYDAVAEVVDDQRIVLP